MYQEAGRSDVWTGGIDRPRVAAVFAFQTADASKAVLHLRQGSPGTPVWLYSTVPPSLELAILCERVFVRSSP